MFQSIYKEKYMSFVSSIREEEKISFITLGPEGTSSYNTIVALKQQIKKLNPEISVDIVLKNNFDLVFQSLYEGKAMYAMVPAAYEKITEFFWEPSYENVFNFSYNTPLYGLVCRVNEDLEEKEELVVASCPAVEKLFNGLKESLAISEIPVRNLRTHSTTEAAKAVVDGKADLAITNESSAEKFGHAIKFISSKLNSQMLWCIFKKKV